jgi:ribosomal protein L11 methyltransferase
VTDYTVLEIVLPARQTEALVARAAALGFPDAVVHDPIRSEPVADGYGLVHDEDAPATVELWCPAPDAATTRALDTLAAEAVARPFGASRVTRRTVSDAEAEAASAWQAAHGVLRIDDAWVMVPSWLEAPAGTTGRVVVTEPGGAFGSGDHATTRDCVRLLTAHVRAGDRVVDLGSGAGLLSLVAAMCGAREVLASDIEALAGTHLAALVQRNGPGLPIRFVRRDWRAVLLHPFDVVVQNIGAEDAAELVVGLGPLRRKPRVVIVSGIARWSAPIVEEALGRAGMAVLEALSEDGDWLTWRVG